MASSFVQVRYLGARPHLWLLTWQDPVSSVIGAAAVLASAYVYGLICVQLSEMLKGRGLSRPKTD